jgi:hypothetical protein
VNADGGRDAIGVGLCLGTAGAVMAVARQYPKRLAAVAALTWPVELWRPDPPRVAMSAARRVLAKARHRLGLPRWCLVAVVAGPSLSSSGTPDWVPPRGAELLARAALAQGWVIAPDRAATLRAGSHLCVPAELAAATATAEADLAVGAAIAILLPPDPASGGPRTGWAGAAGSALDGSDTAGAAPDGIGTAPERLDATFGWAVQRIGDSAGAAVNGVPWPSGPAGPAGSAATRPW